MSEKRIRLVDTLVCPVTKAKEQPTRPPRKYVWVDTVAQGTIGRNKKVGSTVTKPSVMPVMPSKFVKELQAVPGPAKNTP